MKEKPQKIAGADDTQAGESQGLTDFLGGALKQRRLANI